MFKLYNLLKETLLLVQETELRNAGCHEAVKNNQLVTQKIVFIRDISWYCDLMRKATTMEDAQYWKENCMQVIAIGMDSGMLTVVDVERYIAMLKEIR